MIMSKTIRCDLCKRTQPEVDCKYSFRKRWGWLRYDYDSQGGSYTKLDICEECWKKLRLHGGK